MHVRVEQHNMKALLVDLVLPPSSSSEYPEGSCRLHIQIEHISSGGDPTTLVYCTRSWKELYKNQEKKKIKKVNHFPSDFDIHDPH